MGEAGGEAIRIADRKPNGGAFLLSLARPNGTMGTHGTRGTNFFAHEKSTT